MQEDLVNSSALAFLEDQLEAVQRRLVRVRSALKRCDECLEHEALGATLQTTEMERDILWRLKSDQQRDNSVSLDMMILRRVKRAEGDAARLARQWRRGRATPPGYWQAEIKREFLGELLRRFHAWTDERPYYAPVAAPDGQAAQVNGNGRSPFASTAGSYPWFAGRSTDGATDDSLRRSTQELESIYEALHSALEDVIALDHVGLEVEVDGHVIVTGYAHSEMQREVVLDAILETVGVREVLADLKVVAPDACPVCAQPQQS